MRVGLDSASVTVVIPAFNEESRLPATLTRISEALELRGEPYEVLVVVNGSTDRTAEVVKEAAERDSNVRPRYVLCTSTWTA